MKTISITFFSLALVLLAACSSGEDEPGVTVPQDATLTLSVVPGSMQTKSESAKAGEMKEGEDKINNIYAAIFKADGNLLASSYVDYKDNSSNPDTIRVAAKSNTPYKYIILVNVGNQTFSSIEDLKTKMYDLKSIKVDNQPMCSRFIDITSLQPGNNYIGPEEVFKNATSEAFYSRSAVPVYRTASRIDFEKIMVDWSDDDAADLIKAEARFRLKRVYVIDAKEAAMLAEQSDNGNEVEWQNNPTYLNGRAAGEGKYLASLDLFTPESDKTPIIVMGGEYTPTNTARKWQCYVTENTDKSHPTTIILKGDIHPKDSDTPILKDRYFFVRLLNMKDTQDRELSGVIRNYVIRISATITGKGSGDETYRENAYATITVSPDPWAVEETQHEGVN